MNRRRGSKPRFETITLEEFKRKTSHKEFEKDIDELFALFGYDLVYKTWKSLHSPKGFPDRVAVRVKDKRKVWVELKKEGDEPTPEQVQWLEALKAVGEEVYLWYPHDYDEAARILQEVRGL